MTGPGGYAAHVETLPAGARHYRVTVAGEPVTYREAMRLFEGDMSFREFFRELLCAAPYTAFRWETPPVDRGSAARAFEFVLIDAPGLEVAADPHTFRAQLQRAESGVAVFENLGGDALLVAPGPQSPDRVYSHLANFLRGAPPEQVHALLSTLGRTVLARIGDRPLWVSTHGGGVAWLHIRLDSSPKYYGHRDYRRMAWRPLSSRS